MSEYLVDISNPQADGTGVVFHVVGPDRRMKVHVCYETLGGTRKDRTPEEWEELVREIPEILQTLVDKGQRDGWRGPVNWMM